MVLKRHELLDEEAIRKLAKTQDISGFRVVDPLNLRGKAFSKTVSFSGATIVGDLDLSGVPVSGSLLVNGMKVEGDLILDGAKVKGDINLNGTHVDGELSLNGASADEEVTLRGTEYTKIECRGLVCKAIVCDDDDSDELDKAMRMEKRLKPPAAK